MSDNMVGAFGDTSIPDEKQKEILMCCKSEIEEKTGKTYSTFEAIEVKTQVVAGTNYLFTVKTNDDTSIQVKIHQPLPHTGKAPSLMEVM